MSIRLAALVLLALASCRQEASEQSFPKAHRPVAPIVGDSFSTEDVRDRAGRVQPGRRAGRGQARHVGRRRRRRAKAISRSACRRSSGRAGGCWPRTSSPRCAPAWPSACSGRISTMSRCGSARPRTRGCRPIRSTASSWSTCTTRWNRPTNSCGTCATSLKPGGQVIVVDADRPTNRHGTPHALLKCEFAAVGLQLRRLEPVTGADAYFAAFEAVGERPSPADIKPCKG